MSTREPESPARDDTCYTPHTNIEGRCGHRDIYHARLTGYCVNRGCSCRQFTPKEPANG